MSLYDELVAVYPELANESDSKFWSETIVLQDDSDGQGAYIAKWEYSQPIPAGLTLGKPGGN
jgi:XkdW protein